ncbi:MAG: DUF1801 domain-containing protein [Anaerolineales bacterium]|nr:DUF1801 domain-containing protein [Anaerolineales bacterium]
MIAKEITAYNNAQAAANKAICRALATEIDAALPKAENKVWHGGPVWFLDGNPIVGFWVRKHGVQLMFWSGQSFDEPGLASNSEKFKSAVARYESKDDINLKDLKRWLRKSKTIQWDYKNIVKRKGKLLRLKP